ncbi:PAAR motif of membran proteins [Pseudomonas phage Lu11]|uniref:PAAR motif of membran proteins n=1 Tax=Pseudomonas phage Lu11 TaxID=1161927 RepID=UPI00025F180C|nr:PAAR motif of membran proteins [Pseudomonas phage Lu11]AFH14761.1 hypothetical protein Lu11_0224 [Pseudomonas phage Lu11]
MGMPNIRLKIDKSTGHGCFPPSLPVAASMNVFCNGIPEVRVGDAYMTHCCPSKGCHQGTALTGATKTFTNGRLVHTAGGAIDCGDVASNGSPNVFSG